jgi:cytochrome c553
LGVVNAAVAATGDAAAGKSKSAMCAACHGATGESAVEMYPNLAGQHGEYIVKQLKAFKSGDRKAPMMAPMAMGLSDQDMADLGAFFESQGKGGDTASTDSAAPAAPAAGGSAPAPAPKEDESSKFVAAPAVPAGQPSVAAGKTKSAPCAACHGADGNALIPMYPKLAGQSAAYISKQLREFKSCIRVDPVMVSMAAGLSEQDMADLAIYFSKQKSTAGNGKMVDLGHKVYFGGNSTTKVTACAACHGANGAGMGKAGFPSVAGQNAEYLKAQLEKFRSGARNNDLNGIMTSVAMKLTDEEIDALAQTMSALK